MHELALFPLPLVLMPHAPLTLHVFEPRYRQLISNCISYKLPFGVVLVEPATQFSGEFTDRLAMGEWLNRFENEGDEYPDYLPHTVCTTAVIAEHVQLEDGRFLLQCVGGERVRLTGLSRRSPYLVAQVEPWPAEVTPAAKAAAVALTEIYGRYWRAVHRATGIEQTPVDLALDAAEMSWQLAHMLQVDEVRKQEWLMMSTAQRLRSIITAIRAETQTLPKEAPHGSHVGPWSWN